MSFLSSYCMQFFLYRSLICSLLAIEYKSLETLWSMSGFSFHVMWVYFTTSEFFSDNFLLIHVSVIHSFFMFLLISWRANKRKLIYFFLPFMKEECTRLDCCRSWVKSFNSKQWSPKQLIVLLIDEMNLISPFCMSFRYFLRMKENTETK